MRILVAGDGRSAIHEVAVVKAFTLLGHEVEEFYWNSYFQSGSVPLRLWLRFQNKFLYGTVIDRLNRDIIEAAVRFDPELIFAYRGTHLYPGTVAEIKRRLPKCRIYGYNNDDPFASGHPSWLWRHFIRSVPVYDMVFAYRRHNLDDFMRIGAKRVDLLRSWYIPEINHPVLLTDKEKDEYACDVVFVGHYEDDGRLGFLEEIVHNGFTLRLFGPDYEWNHLLRKSEVLRHLDPIHLVWNGDYNKALAGGKIALCFFSKLNRDTYTRRCFEIPAAGTLLLSEYSDDIAGIYREGVEADFFKSKEEMIRKISLYMNDECLRCRVASNGHKRVVDDGHDVVSRMKHVLGTIDHPESTGVLGRNAE